MSERRTIREAARTTPELFRSDSNYFYTVPADTEFPRRVEKLELFVRFFARDRLAGHVFVTMSLQSANASANRTVYRKRFPLPPTTADGPIVADVSFNLHNVVIPAEGTYAFHVLRRVKRRWSDKPEWRVLATERVYIERAT